MEEKKAKSLEEVYHFLSEYHLSNSLRNIAVITACFRHGADNLSLEYVPEHLQNWMSVMSFGQRLNLFLSATRLARFMLLSGANDQNERVLTLESGNIFDAMDMAFTLYDKDVERKINTFLDRSRLLGRISQWQFPLQDDIKAILGRGYLLFILIAQKYEDAYSFDSKMKEYFGIGAFEFMATGFSIWLKAEGTIDCQLEVEIEELKDIVTPENQLCFIELSSGTATDYKILMRGPNFKEISKLNEIYGLDGLMKIPAIEIGCSDKTGEKEYIIPQPKYLFDRASSGIFHLLASEEQSLAVEKGQKQDNPFRRIFGTVYRDYVGTQLKQTSSMGSLVDLDEDFASLQSMKKPDFALINGNSCLLIEVKTSLLNVEARTYFNESDLRSAVEEGSLKKAIVQLSEFKQNILSEKILDVRFKHIKRVITLLIGYEDIFVLNASLLPLIKEYYPALAIDLQLGCITDIESIGAYISCNDDLVQKLETKLDVKESEFDSIMSYLEKDGRRRSPIIDYAAYQFFARLGLH